MHRTNIKSEDCSCHEHEKGRTELIVLVDKLTSTVETQSKKIIELSDKVIALDLVVHNNSSELSKLKLENEALRKFYIKHK